jgi:hypothetical protein
VRYVLIMTKQYSLHFEIVIRITNLVSRPQFQNQVENFLDFTGDKTSVLKHFNGTNSVL